MIVIVVAVLFILSFIVYYRGVSSTGGNTTTTGSFVYQPVGDVIIPKISRNYGSGVTNLPLNLTVGETTNLTVSLYLQIDANVTSQFRVLTWAGGPSGISAITASFSPENFSVSANKNASSVLTVHVSSSAPVGQYTVVVSFEDASNPSYVWGTNIQVNVERS